MMEVEEMVNKWTWDSCSQAAKSPVGQEPMALITKAQIQGQ